MAPITVEEKLDYILTCLSTAGPVKLDYKTVASEKGINNANNAQKAFKKFVEESGKFKLVNGAIVAADGSGTASAGQASAPATPTKKSSVKKQDSAKRDTEGKPNAKKRKLKAETDGDEDKDGEAADED